MLSSKHSVLVTGGAGFIGSHLVEDLVGRDVRVTVADNFSTGCRANIESVFSRIHVISGDMGEMLRSDRPAPSGAEGLDLAGFDVVFHLAANAYIPPSVEDPAFDFNTNLVNTFTLLERLRALDSPPRLVNVSTAGVYGSPTKLPIREDDPTVPISPYGVSKLAAEGYVAVYCALYGLRACSLRLFSVYGPRQRKQVVYDLMCKLKTDPKRLTVLGDGSQERDFVYVTDVVQALLLAAESAPGRGEVYNVATGTTHSIASLVEAVCRDRGASPETTFTGQVRRGDAEKWVVDISEISALGFEPRVPLEHGLREVSQWFDTIPHH